MDQLTISAGGVSLMDFGKLTEPTIDSQEWKFDDLDIFVIGTGGDHSDLTEDYAAIKGEMNAIAKYFGKNILREVDENKFNKVKDELRKTISDRAVDRAEHFFEENKRVMDAYFAVKKKDEKAIFSVTNHGSIINEDKKNKIWDEYYRDENSHKRNTVGTGLGLSICKSVFELHHLEYGVTSNEADGTTFYFLINIK